VGRVARMGERTGAYRVVVGKPEGKRPHGRPWRRWEDITMHVKEIVREGMNWIELAQDRDKWWAVVNTVMNVRVSLNVGNFLASRRTSISKSALRPCVSRFNDQTAYWIMRDWNTGKAQATCLFSIRRDWLGGPRSLTFQGTRVLCPALQRPSHEAARSPPLLPKLRSGATLYISTPPVQVCLRSAFRLNFNLCVS
jgi:hypothetical protein